MNSWSAVRHMLLIAWLELLVVRAGLWIPDISWRGGVKYGRSGGGGLHHKVLMDEMLSKHKKTAQQFMWQKWYMVVADSYWWIIYKIYCMKPSDWQRFQHDSLKISFSPINSRRSQAKGLHQSQTESKTYRQILQIKIPNLTPYLTQASVLKHSQPSCWTGSVFSPRKSGCVCFKGLYLYYEGKQWKRKSDCRRVEFHQGPFSGKSSESELLGIFSSPECDSSKKENTILLQHVTGCNQTQSSGDVVFVSVCNKKNYIHKTNRSMH